jgi:4-amino-4-deoxy-L-arabinose transferase-like glycosyltransferase
MQNILTKPLNLFDRLREALCDGRRRERTVALLLAGYTGIWTLYDLVSRSGEGIHHDMGEMVAWSRDLSLGSPKHPQMGAWIAGLWFSIFPERDWAFYLLANVLIAITLWFAWRLTENRLSDDKRVAGLAFLMLVPFFNFFAWKYNANTILIPLWAATTFFFIRSVETRTPTMAALAGLAAAAAMMGKYWSIFLLAGLALAALLSPQRREYFRSAAPWITIAAGALALAPHLYWMASHQFVTVDYALKGHRAGSVFNSLKDAGIYLSGIAAYLALPVFLLIWFARPKWQALLDTLWPQAGARRFLLAAFSLPILLPIPIALLNQTDLASIWAMPACILAPVVFLSSPKLEISHAAARKILAVAAAFSVVALVIAPARALRIRETGALHYADCYKPVARTVMKQWRKASGGPLAVFGSTGELMNGASFYITDRPSVLNIAQENQTPAVDAARVSRQGIAIACPMEDARCVQAAATIARAYPGARSMERNISRHYRGAASRGHRVLIVTIPPATV